MRADFLWLFCLSALEVIYANLSHNKTVDHHTRHKNDQNTVQQAGMLAWLPAWVFSSADDLPLLSYHGDIDSSGFLYHGQHLEDKYAYESFFVGKVNGMYVEIGGLDGVFISNTLFFHDFLGWRGLLVEPSPENYSKLVKNRPNDINVNSAVCSNFSNVHFAGKGGAVSGIWEFMSEEFRQTWHKKAKLESLPVIPCIPLQVIFTKFAVKHIDFFSLDVENAELEVLRTINFDLLHVSVLSVEADGRNPAKDAAVIELLTNSGFTHVGKIHRNDWFVNKVFNKP